MMEQITLGLSVHRPEMIPSMTQRMRRHDAIVLEELASPGFGKMLSGSMSIAMRMRLTRKAFNTRYILRNEMPPEPSWPFTKPL